MKHYEIYYWTGFVVIWILALIAGCITGYQLWRLFKLLRDKLYIGSALFYWIDYHRAVRRFTHHPLKDLKSISVRRIWEMEKRVLLGTSNHPYGQRIVDNVFSRIKELNPAFAEDFKLIDAEEKEWREDYLRNHEWSQYYNLNYWVNPRVTNGDPGMDHTNHGMDVWHAYQLQQKWKEEDEAKESEAETTEEDTEQE